MPPPEEAQRAPRAREAGRRPRAQAARPWPTSQPASPRSRQQPAQMARSRPATPRGPRVRRRVGGSPLGTPRGERASLRSPSRPRPRGRDLMGGTGWAMKTTVALQPRGTATRHSRRRPSRMRVRRAWRSPSAPHPPAGSWRPRSSPTCPQQGSPERRPSRPRVSTWQAIYLGVRDASPQEPRPRSPPPDPRHGARCSRHRAGSTRAGPPSPHSRSTWMRRPPPRLPAQATSYHARRILPRRGRRVATTQPPRVPPTPDVARRAA